MYKYKNTNKNSIYYDYFLTILFHGSLLSKIAFVTTPHLNKCLTNAADGNKVKVCVENSSNCVLTKYPVGINTAQSL